MITVTDNKPEGQRCQLKQIHMAQYLSLNIPCFREWNVCHKHENFKCNFVRFNLMDKNRVRILKMKNTPP